MKTRILHLLAAIGPLLSLFSLNFPADAQDSPVMRKTSVSIVGDQFYLNGKPTYEGHTWNGHKIEGLLLNARMVQGIFDDRNHATVQRWAYPDTTHWDPERNTREFLAAMPEWRQHGLLAFTINLQGGAPARDARDQPWHNSAIESDGSLRPDYLARLERILDQADDLGLVVILGYFYFGQDQRLQDEAAVIRATERVTQWLLDHDYRHVLVEINNECNVRYDHPILQPPRVHELITRVRAMTRNHRRLYVGVSYGGGAIPGANVVRVSDFLLLHGNGVSEPERIAQMVRQTRAVPGYFPKPILFNEDDHFDFEKPKNNFTAALGEYASWGYFDPGTNNYVDGYQSPPVNWGLSTERKAAFFQLLGEITGTDAAVRVVRPPAAFAHASLADQVTLRQAPYHGWSNAFFLSNGKVQTVVVPAIGRVMQFGFVGEEGVFWENRALDGRPPDPDAPDWINFGGDKTWPAPEGDWSQYTRRLAWRPPPAFDAMPITAQAQTNGDLLLISPVDPFLGIRTYRRIHLDPALPVMTITTRFERVSGPPIPVSVWVVTQLKNPVRLFAPLPKSKKAAGYALLSKQHPPGVQVKKGLLSLSRDPQMSHKIGCAANSLLWVSEQAVLRIDSPRVAEAVYPDQNSNAEIYTNPDPLPYIELETLGPTQTLKPGDRLERVNTYTLLRRTEDNPETEARKLLAR